MHRCLGWNRLALLTVVALLLPALRVGGADAEIESIWAAVERNDPRSLRRQLQSVDCNETRDGDGHSPLTLAASMGSFECVRELLWGGALADMPNEEGLVAKQCLKRSESGFMALNLLIRCHAFGQKEGKIKLKAGVPHRVLVNDTFVDPFHPDFKDYYWFNEEEEAGGEGQDDDKNGFVDDVSGWNLEDDLPQEVPQFGFGAGVKADWLQKLTEEVTLINRGLDKDGKVKSRLESRYENPIFKQLGRRLAGSGGVSMNDFNYGKLVNEASHGVHVAGIVSAESRQEAELHAVAFYGFSGGEEGSNDRGFRKFRESCKTLAPKIKDYQSYVKAVRDVYVQGRIGVGRRFSDYIKSVDCGVVNMSLSEPKSVFKGLAEQMRAEYQSRGMNPKTIESYKNPEGMDLGADLGLELRIAFASSYALAMAENPDVLFVVAAGNSSEDVDVEMPLPAAMSRFFPNVVTVASVGPKLVLSSFSNRGERSVQVAAMGEKIRSSFLGGVHGEMSGTSMASPAVAGVAARIRAGYPKLSALDVRRVILASAKPVEGLKGKVSTGAVVSGDGAMQVASKWAAGEYLFLDEPWDWPMAGSKSQLVKQATPPSSSEGGATLKGTGPLFNAKPQRRVMGIGGYWGSWRVVTSTEVSGPQHFLVSKEWPKDWLSANQKQGFAVSSLAGDSGGWAVAMSKMPLLSSQRLVGHEFDQAQIKLNMEGGDRIRSVAGFGDKWVIVMDRATGYGAQRYTLPGSFDEKRVDWIKARWDEGYRITSVAGTAGADKSLDSWVVVMSEKSGIGAQGYRGPGEWPTEWIKEKWDDGFAITSVSGHGIGHWVVVMSKIAGLKGLQGYSGKLDSPNDWIEEKWKTPLVPAKSK